MPDTKLNVRAYPIDEPKGNTKGFANIAINDQIAIRNIRVIENNEGNLFIAMPQRFNKKTEEYNNIVSIDDKALNKEIAKAVIGEFNRMAELPPEERRYEAQGKGEPREIDISGVSLDIKVYPLGDNGGNTKAFAALTVDDSVTINGLRLVEGEKGLFVSMPQTQDKTGEYRDIAFPLNADLRKEITKAVIGKYEEKCAEKASEKSLASGLKQGARKAAEASAIPRDAAAKSRAGVLE